MKAFERMIDGKKFTSKITENDFIKVEITEEMRRSAYKRAEVVRHSKYAIQPFEIRKQGFLGEEMFKKVFPNAIATVDLEEAFQFDFVLNDNTWEIKTKLLTAIPPRLHYEGSKNDYNKDHQKSDFIVFAYVEKKAEPTVGWLGGYITKENFDKSLREIKVGDELQNGFKAKMHTWNVYLSQCWSLKQIRDFRRDK